ncbi:MAG: hypothetical protein AAF658_10065, partial [Myxococcota bacterium]
GALPIVRRRFRDQADAFVLPGGLAIPALALVVSVWLLFQVKLASWLATGAALVVGAALYSIARGRLRSASRST